MDPTEYLKRLGSALENYRYDEVRSLTDLVDPNQFTSKEAKNALGMLRRKRRFVDLEHLAMLFIAAEKGELNIRRQWAQALLDQNRVEQGLSVLSRRPCKPSQVAREFYIYNHTKMVPIGKMRDLTVIGWLTLPIH